MKKVTYWSEAELEALKWAAKVIDFGVSLTVTMAFNELYTAFVALRGERVGGKWTGRHYKQSVKKLANDAVRAADLQKRAILDVMINKDFVEEYTDRVIDLAEQDVTLFRVAVKQTLDDAGHEEAALMAQVEVARVILQMAVKQFDEVCNEAKKKFPNHDYVKDFSEYRCGKVLVLWEKVCDILYKGGKANLNNDRTKGIFDKMCAKFADGYYVSECLKEAQKEYPEFSNAVVVKEK